MLDITYGPWFFVHSAYSYLLLLIGTMAVILMLVRSPHLYRLQAAVLLTAVAVPWLGNGLYLSGASPLPHLDLTPFAFTLSGLMFAWGLFRLRLFDIIPVARRAVIDGLQDAVMVLDPQNRVVDLNPVALQIINAAPEQVFGQPVERVLANYAEFLEKYRGQTNLFDEITLERDGQVYCYELRISPLLDNRGEAIGRIVTLHDVTSRRQAEEALRRQKQLFESLVAVARATTEQPTLQATLQNAVNVAASLTHAEGGNLILLDEELNITYYIPVSGQHPPEKYTPNLRQVMQNGLAGWVARQRQPVLIADVTSDPRWLPLPDAQTDPTRAAVSVPILSGTKMVGVLTLTHSQPGYFSADHLNLLQAAVDQMALAVRNAQIFDAQRELAGRQITLYEVLKSVAGQTDPDYVLRIAVETIVQFAGWPNILVALPAEQPQHWLAHTATGQFAALSGQVFPAADNPVGQVFSQRQTRYFASLDAQPSAGDLLQQGIQSLLAVPLRRGQRILGVVAIGAPQPGAFSADDTQLAESVVEAVALALDNANLYAETRRRLKAQTALQKAGAVITSTLDLDTILSNLAEQLARSIDVTSATICGYEPDTLTAVVLAEYFSPDAAPQEQVSLLNSRFDLERDFPRLVALLRNGETDIIHADAPYLPDARRTSMQTAGIQTSLIIPLQIRGETIAYAELRESRRKRHFTAEEIDLCRGIAQQAAIAIEHARFYDEARQQASGLSALYTVTRMVGQSLVLEEVVSQALNSAMILLEFEAGAVSLVDPHTGTLKTSVQRGLTRELLGYLEADTPGTLHRRVFDRQETIALTDVAAASADTTPLKASGVHGYVGIPLVHRQQTLGVLSLFAYRKHDNLPTSLSTLSAIGQQIAVAVTNARLFQAIEDERSRLSALINASRDGVILISMDRRILVTNQPTLEYLQLPGQPEDWMGRSLDDVLGLLRHHAPEAVRATTAELRRVQKGDEAPGEGEYRVGHRFLYWFNLPVATGSIPLGRLIVLRDVTQERQLEKLRDDLTHTMVHDLRNPLTAISGALQLVEMMGHTLSPEQKRLVEMASRNTDRLLELVNSILEVSRLESGRITLELRRTDVSRIVQDVLQMQNPLAEQNAVRLETDFPTGLPLVWADIRILERVLQNLVGNALKFTPREGKVTVSARIHQPAEAQTGKNGRQSQVVVSVSDTGPGIPPEIQARLFQKFVTGGQEKSGSGLGLAFCKLAVEAHGGRIWVESKPGQGATFSFTLPIAATDAQPPEKRAIQVAEG
ncbi:MAG: GAF domain-containing protein [Chloroflexi bacterium]|nr:MAG: GAF domain-containing protein [Chloroflexota bacterium]